MTRPDIAAAMIEQARLIRAEAGALPATELRRFFDLIFKAKYLEAEADALLLARKEDGQ